MQTNSLILWIHLQVLELLSHHYHHWYCQIHHHHLLLDCQMVSVVDSEKIGNKDSVDAAEVMETYYYIDDGASFALLLITGEFDWDDIRDNPVDLNVHYFVMMEEYDDGTTVVDVVVVEAAMSIVVDDAAAVIYHHHHHHHSPVDQVVPTTTHHDVAVVAAHDVN